MNDFSVMNYAEGNGDALTSLGFEEDEKNHTCTSTFWVTDISGIRVIIDTVTCIVRFYVVYQDSVGDSLQREDVLPYDLDIHSLTEFSEWLDDAIGEMYTMCPSQEDEDDFANSYNSYDE